MNVVLLCHEYTRCRCMNALCVCWCYFLATAVLTGRKVLLRGFSCLDCLQTFRLGRHHRILRVDWLGSIWRFKERIFNRTRLNRTMRSHRPVRSARACCAANTAKIVHARRTRKKEGRTGATGVEKILEDGSIRKSRSAAVLRRIKAFCRRDHVSSRSR